MLITWGVVIAFVAAVYACSAVQQSGDTGGIGACKDAARGAARQPDGFTEVTFTRPIENGLFVKGYVGVYKSGESQVVNYWECEAVNDGDWKADLTFSQNP